MIDSTTVAELFTRWDIPWIVTSGLALSAMIYARGWLRIRRTRPAQFPAWRLATFLGGIVALFVAVASPLDTFSESLAVHAHGAAFRAHVRCPAAHRPRGACCSHAARIAQVDHSFAKATLPRACISPRRAISHLPTGRLAGHECSVHRMAHSARLRVRPRFRELAQLRACLLFLHELDVLVAHHPAVAEPFGATALVCGPLSLARRPREHGSLGFPLLLGTPALSELWRYSAPFRAERAQRSDCSRRFHVGLRIDGILAACSGSYHATSFLFSNIKATASRTALRLSNERDTSSLTLASTYIADEASSHQTLALLRRS